MNAKEALKLTQENWCQNEQEYLKYIVGYQQKVEIAAQEGKISCVVGTLPSGNAALMDFSASFFEQMGFYVGFQGTPTGEVSIYLNWKNEPTGSRPYLESKEINKMLA